MELEEAIQTLNEMKYLEIRPEYKVQAIERVLKELDKKDKVINLMAEDMATIMKDGCSPRKDVKYEYIINRYKNLLERKADK